MPYHIVCCIILYVVSYSMPYHIVCWIIHYAVSFCMPYHIVFCIIQYAVSYSMPYHIVFCIILYSVSYSMPYHIVCWIILYAVSYCMLYHTVCHIIPYAVPYVVLTLLAPFCEQTILWYLYDNHQQLRLHPKYILSKYSAKHHRRYRSDREAAQGYAWYAPRERPKRMAAHTRGMQ